tara:strand:- start:7 stop:945 length:939 start_codon:yes stop_codon:yes gene_type:complete
VNDSWKTFDLTCLTPCFCAGQDQAKAEIRASSIRGSLRWWYRALGGSNEREAAIFGGVKGSAKASQIAVRVGDIEKGPPWKPDLSKEFGGRDRPGSWIWHFATVAAGKKRWTKQGSRDFNQEGHLPPETTFKLYIKTSKVADADPLWIDSLNCFLLLGSIGMRATRGMGALQAINPPKNEEEIKAFLNNNGFLYKSRKTDGWKDTIFQAEQYLKEHKNLRGQKYKAGKFGDRPSPLGSATPRQTSSVWFRPIYLEGSWKLVIFEAPHQRVLGRESKKAAPGQILNDLDLTEDPPKKTFGSTRKKNWGRPRRY